MRKEYMRILFEEIDSLALVAKSDKMDRTKFCMQGKTHQSAIKMSISIIAKCLTGLSLDVSVFKQLKYLSNLIGHEIGETEQIRYYDFDDF